jgi:hypothetical protein
MKFSSQYNHSDFFTHGKEINKEAEEGGGRESEPFDVYSFLHYTYTHTRPVIKKSTWYTHTHIHTHTHTYMRDTRRARILTEKALHFILDWNNERRKTSCARKKRRDEGKESYIIQQKRREKKIRRKACQVSLTRSFLRRARRGKINLLKMLIK